MAGCWCFTWLIFAPWASALPKTYDVVDVLGEASGAMHFNFSNTTDWGLLSQLHTQLYS
jgi:hypothetical protein